MDGRIRLVLAIHNHQPVGNFDHVFEEAFQKSYAPFLNVLRDYPEIPICLHTSGSLMEWLVQFRPEYIEDVKTFVQRGQIEILGGPFYEPILGCIPPRDRVAQMETYNTYLEELFDTKVKGMWVPERVWEQAFAGDITAAGIEYTMLDDTHFKNAGFKEEELDGYFLTEQEGRLLKIFPDSEPLRYCIPFADVEKCFEHLRLIEQRSPGSVVLFGDDGEKFGSWPGTYKHVYEEGWLRRFFDLLRENSEWLKVCTMEQAVSEVAPIGRCYLPDASYREMTEWALPTDLQKQLQQIVKQKENDEDWPVLKQFVRGSNWRNFLVKYPESNEMYTRMWEISNRLSAMMLDSNLSEENAALLQEAQTELFRGQCNCPYWHGAFGGLYLPHLRNAIYRHLISADSLLEKCSDKPKSWVEIEADDYNFDARQEIRIASHSLVTYLAPAKGGHIYELDVRASKHNLLATLNRRPEPYHDRILEQATDGGHDDGGLIDKPHEQVHCKQPDLDKKIKFDTYPRKTLVDHFFNNDLNLEQYASGEGEVGDFVQGVYETRMRKSPEWVEAIFSRQGIVGHHSPTVTKTIRLSKDAGSQFEIHYLVENLPPNETLHFGVEFNFAGMAAGADDRYFYGADGGQLGQLQTMLDLQNTNRLGLVDEWLGIDTSLEFSKEANIWTFPIETVSQSEGGFESVHQSTVVTPHWYVTADEEGKWETTINFVIDTSMIQARQLREVSPKSKETETVG